MAEKEIDLRRLVIKAFHMTDVEWGEHNNITTDGHMTVSKEMIDQLVAQDDCIEKIDIQIIKTGRPRQMDEHDHGYHSNLNKSTW